MSYKYNICTCVCVCVCYLGHKILANHVLYGFYWLAINLFFCLSVSHKSKFTLFKNTKNMGTRNHCLVCQSLDIITKLKIQKST